MEVWLGRFHCIYGVRGGGGGVEQISRYIGRTNNQSMWIGGEVVFP